MGHAEVVADHARPGAASLLIDGFVHGHHDPTDPGRLTLDYQARLTAIVLAFVPTGPARVLHLGGGAFAIPRALAVANPDLTQTIVEKSAAIIGLAQRELGLRRSDRLVVRKGDARTVLGRLPTGSADVVVGDAFVGHDTPPQLVTVQAMTEVRRVMGPTGRYVINIIDHQPWGKLAVQAAAAMEVFADVVAMGSRGVARLRDPGNVFLIASDTALPRTALTAAGARCSHPAALVSDGRLTDLTRGTRPRHDCDG